MKQNWLFIVILLSIFQIGCKDEIVQEKNNKGEIICNPFLWQKNMSSYAYNRSEDFFICSHENSIITEIYDEDDKEKVISIDSKSGEVNWENDDIYSMLFSLPIAYKYNNYLLYTYDDDINIFDLNNGKQIGNSKSTYMLNQNKIEGIGDQVFLTDDYMDFRLNQYDILNLTNIKIADLNDKIDRESSSGFIKVFQKDSKLYVLQAYSLRIWQEYYPADVTIDTYFRLFDVENKTWIYDKMVLQGELSKYALIQYNNLICKNSFSGISYCFNIITGNQIWQDESNYLGSEFYSNSSCFISSTSSNGIVSRDISNGEILWQNKDINAQYIQELSGIIYCIDYKNDYNKKATLCAIEVSTGKVLWRIVAPNDQNFLKVTVVSGKDGEKGRIVVETMDKMFCYEAYK